MKIPSSFEARKMIKLLALFALFSLVSGDTSSEVEGTSKQLDASSEIDGTPEQLDIPSEEVEGTSEQLATSSELERNLQQLNDSDRIFGGFDIGIEEVPYRISLRYRNIHHCGGSIISREWVLTAAQCVENVGPNYFTVLAVTNNQLSGGSLHAVSRIVSHKKYTSEVVPIHDIALVKVREFFVFDATRQPIRLFDKKTPDYTLGTISRWRAVSNGTSPQTLRVVHVSIIPKATCAKTYEDYGGLSAGQICAGSFAGGKDACQGDSGDPLTVGDYLVGIVSWGVGCGDWRRPGVYTEIAAYRTFIKYITGI